MSTEIYNIQPPDHTLVLSPQSTPDYVYERTDGGQDLIGVFFTDSAAGPVFIALHPTLAQELAVNLTAMLGQLDTLRIQWQHHRRESE